MATVLGIQGDVGRTTLLDAVIESIRRSHAYNANDAAPPAVVLWPDAERQWVQLIPLLAGALPILTFGAYDPGTRTGPAYWLRCMVDRTLPQDRIPVDETPVIYLPGVSRGDLRAVESCPPALQPLAELQYRGVIWSHKNGKDWTVPAFLQNGDGGLGLSLDGSKGARDALALALPLLARRPLASLRAEPLIDEQFLLDLVNPDSTSRLLRWLNDQPGERLVMTHGEWTGFCQHCRKHLDFDPEKDGALTAARKLGERKKNWRFVWSRYADAAAAFPGVGALLKQASPPYNPPLMEEQQPWPGKDDSRSSWPGLNEGLEGGLRMMLAALHDRSAADAAAAVIDLDLIHGARRDWLWARLGQSPLATSLEALARVARLSARPLLGTTADELAAAYASTGWEIDAAAMGAAIAVKSANQADQKAVQAALDAIYRPWLTQLAIRFQQVIAQNGYVSSPPLTSLVGTCYLFCDGLRYDFGARLLELAKATGTNGEMTWRLAALPTVTPTAKPAIMPIAETLIGGNDLSVRSNSTTTSLTAEASRKLLALSGWQALAPDQLGDPSGYGWTELGAIDSYGHAQGWKVAGHAVDEIREIVDHARTLLEAGWQRVIIATDHGWLLLPQPLPKAELPINLAEPRKGRCARLKPGASVELQTLPWHWDPSVLIAYAPGISCFESGKTYEHGGLSLQECVTPVITLSAGGPAANAVALRRIHWTNLKCSVIVANAAPGSKVDLRRSANDSNSSVAAAMKRIDPDGTAALFVVDSDLEGAALELSRST